MYHVCTIIVLTIQKIRLVLSIKRAFTKFHQNKILQILQIPQLRILQTVLKFVRLTVRQAVFNQNVMVLIALKLNALLAVNYLHVASQIVP
jgi:hypothetical protein